MAPLDSSTAIGEKFTIKWVVRAGKPSPAAAAAAPVGHGDGLSICND
jgi:hypothetical protein